MDAKRMLYLPMLGLLIFCEFTQSAPMKESDLEGQLRRVKRFHQEDEPILSREKRRDLQEQVLERQKRDDAEILSREKRPDETLQRQKRNPDEPVLARTKREEETLQRMKRLDMDEPNLERVKRVEVVRRKRDADEANQEEDPKAEKTKRTVKANDGKSPKRLAKKSETGEPRKRSQGYWEKRSRGDFLIHRANKRGKYHKRRYMKRAHPRFLKKKKIMLAKKAALKQARERKNEKEFVKKSFQDKLQKQ